MTVKSKHFIRQQRRVLGLLIAWTMIGPPIVAISGQARDRADQSGPLTDQVAFELLQKMTSGLASHNRERMLAAFDIPKMQDGLLFKQHVTSLFARTAVIRFRFNQLRVAAEGGRGVITVMGEIEADPREGDRLPVHKQAQLRFLAEKSETGWKLTGVEPQAFFFDQP